MTDTSREAVEYWARHHADPRVLEVTDALLAERDAAFQVGYAAGFDRGQCHGAETMRERAAAVAAGVEAHQETEAYAARLRCDSVADNECRIGSTAAGLIADAICALPLVQP
jgi:hypothetical protein